MGIADLLERKAKDWPGIVKTGALLGALAALLQNKRQDDLKLWQTVLIAVLAALVQT